MVDLTALSSNFASPLISAMTAGIRACGRCIKASGPVEQDELAWTPLRRLTSNESADLVLAHQAGESVASLSNRFDVNRCTVYEHLENAGVPRQIPKPKLTEAQITVAHELYLSGLSTAAVGAQLGVSAATVATHLRRAGCQIRIRRGWTSEGSPG
jgi:ATP/maltotriose-dependent transcriptional regulator MalT